MDPEDSESYSAEKWKELGNTAFKEKNWTEAKNCFSKAIELNPNSEIFYSNRSAAELYLRSYDEALSDAGMEKYYYCLIDRKSHFIET